MKRVWRSGLYEWGTGCPLCGGESVKVIYAGLPARLCNNESCSALFSGFAEIISLLPFNGMFLVYEGSYWKALWRWLWEKR